MLALQKWKPCSTLDFKGVEILSKTYATIKIKTDVTQS